jgi:hypothetical protein
MCQKRTHGHRRRLSPEIDLPPRATRALRQPSGAFMKIITAFAVGLALAGVLSAAPAQAQNTHSFVSGHGSDAANCTLAAPCRTLARAFLVTKASGEIGLLDPAGYGALTINKAISIVNDGVGTAGVMVPSAGVGITINAGTNDAVSLRGLTIDGGGVANTTGIQFNSGKFLAIDNCVVRHVANDGIGIFPTNAAGFSIINTVTSDNGAQGIYIAPKNLGSAQGAITGVVAHNNFDGIALDAQNTTGTTASSVTIVRSVTANNSDFGISAQNAGTPLMSVLVRDTNSSHNGFAGDNDISGNVTDVNATLTTITMH